MKTNDPQAQDRARKAEDLRKVQMAEDWRAVLGVPEGRRLLATIIAEAGFGAFGFSVYGADAHAMAVNAGRQSVGHDIASRAFELQPQLYTQMVTEQATREARLREAVK